MPVLPNGFLTILEAADRLSQTMHSGTADAPAVTRLREEGFDVADREARPLAIEKIWIAVDRGDLRALAIGGRPRRIIKLDPAFTRSVPALRSARGRGFTMLRQSNPSYGQLASWFGPLLHTAILAIRETEVQKLARKLMRARRNAQRAGVQESRRGGEILCSCSHPAQLPLTLILSKDSITPRRDHPMLKRPRNEQ